MPRKGSWAGHEVGEGRDSSLGFHGDDASEQPGQSGDRWLHETAVSWMRHRLRLTVPQEPWRESVEDYEARLKAAAAHINEHHDIDGLCKEMPERMRLLGLWRRASGRAWQPPAPRSRAMSAATKATRLSFAQVAKQATSLFP